MQRMHTRRTVQLDSRNSIQAVHVAVAGLNVVSNMGLERFASGRNLPRARVRYKDGSNVPQGVLDPITCREDSAVRFGCRCVARAVGCFTRPTYEKGPVSTENNNVAQLPKRSAEALASLMHVSRGMLTFWNRARRLCFGFGGVLQCMQT